MASIKLTNVRTSTAEEYPLALFDYDGYYEYIEGSQTYIKEVALSETACTGIPGVRWQSFSDAQKKMIYIEVRDLASRWLSDSIAPSSQRNLLYIAPGTKWADLFTPVLTESPITYSTSPPEDYGTNNTYGLYWQQYGIPFPDGVRGVGGNYAWAIDGTQNVLYRNESAAKLFRTVNGGTFGVSTFTGNRTYSGSQHAFCATFIGAKQYVNANRSPDGNAEYAGQWAMQNPEGIGLCASYPNARGATWSAFQLPLNVYDKDSLCATEQISTQVVQINIGTQAYFGACTILWEMNGQTGIYQPTQMMGYFYPGWVWGGTSGEYTPDIPPISEEIPPRVTSHENGTWTIVNNPAGTASIPTGSPLSSIGAADAGMHLYILNSDGVKRVSEALWSSALTTEARENMISSIIHCGILPYKFVAPLLTNNRLCTSMNVGCINLVAPSNSVWHLNDVLFYSSYANTDTIEFENILTKTYANYLDYEPYTAVSLTLPFCGEMSLPASACIGGKVSIDYNCNLTNGDVCASIRTESSDIITKGTKDAAKLNRTFYTTGNCMVPFPLTGSTNGLSQMLRAVPELASGVISFGTGNFSAGASSLKSATETMNQLNPIMVTGGTTIGGPSIIGNKKVILSVTRPSPYYQNEFMAYNPIGNGGYGKLKSFKQTQNISTELRVDRTWDKVIVSDIELSPTATIMTKAEIERARALLREGVLL